MKNLSISQSYLLCALNEKGKLPALKPEIPVCLVAAGVMDLVLSGSVLITNKKLSVTEELDNNNQYLQSLYNFIKEAQSITLQNLASAYSLSPSSKMFNELLKDIGDSLEKNQLVASKKGGIFGKTILLFPDLKEVDHIIQTIRAEILESGNLSEEIMILTSLLEKSGRIKHFFSKYENKQLKERINEIRKDPNNQHLKEIVDDIIVMFVIIAS